MEQMNQLKKDYVTPQERLMPFNPTRKEKRKKTINIFKQKQAVSFIGRKNTIRNRILKRLICRELWGVIKNLKHLGRKVMNIIVSLNALKNYTFLSRSTVWRLVQKGGFLKPISFGHSKSKDSKDK